MRRHDGVQRVGGVLGWRGLSCCSGSCGGGGWAEPIHGREGVAGGGFTVQEHQLLGKSSPSMAISSSMSLSLASFSCTNRSARVSCCGG